MFARIENFIFLEANRVIKEDLNARIEHVLFYEDRIISFQKPWQLKSGYNKSFHYHERPKQSFFQKQFCTQEYLNARIENSVKNVHGENFFLELILIR